MSQYTDFLNLFKWDSIEDAEQELDIDKALNDNWDKVDIKLKTHINYVNSKVNNLEQLVNSAQNFYKYVLKIETKVNAGQTITIPCKYIVGKDVITIYINGERLLKSSDDSGTDGHYREIGETNSISNQIKTTSDFSLEKDDILEFVVRGDYSDSQ